MNDRITNEEIEKVRKLSDEELHIKVAEYRGWTYLHRCNMAFGCRGPLIGLPPIGDPRHEAYFNQPVPNYPTDLNEMHEIEKTLSDEQWKEYRHWLTYTTWINMQYIIDFGLRQEISASARHRAEAYVITMSFIK